MNKAYRIILAVFSLLLVIQCSDQSTQVDDPTTGDNGNGGEPPASFSHTQAPGHSNEAFIMDIQYDQLVVEIQFMPGSEPNEASLHNLQDFLEQHLDKSSVTILNPSEIPSGGQDSYTSTDVRSLEDQYREEFTDGSTLASYVVFLDGEYETENVLGIAYYNTSTAYFHKTIDRISGGIGQPSHTQIESTVFAHEFGHLMGLVNNGTDAQADHYDSENSAHCTVEECLMYYSVETTDFFANLFDGSVPELDDFCVADVEAVKN